MSDDFVFNDNVLKEFEFLLNHDFRLAECGDRSVRYESALYTITVFQDRDGIALALNMAAAAWKNSIYFRTLLRKFSEEAAYRLPRYDAVKTHRDAKERIQLIAENFKRHVDFSAFHSTALFKELTSIAEKEFSDRYPTTTVEQIRSRFQPMWDHQQYNELIKLFSPLSEHLTDNERNKLDIARRVISDAGNA